MEIDKAQLMAMTKEQLIELLDLAVKGQMAANKNMATINAMCKQLKDENEALVARVRVLESNPFAPEGP